MNFRMTVSYDGEYHLAVAEIQVLVGSPATIRVCEGRARSRTQARAAAYALGELAENIFKAER